MSAGRDALLAHLQTGVTTVCRAWDVSRKDGVRLGFTDHDRDLEFDGLVYRADTGLTAKALAQSTGLSVDNTEAAGALSSDAISERDIAAGRYDDASVRSWVVNWAAPEERMLLFRGTIGEVVRAGGAFRADLRGLSEALNRPDGRVFQRGCSALLGDQACAVDLTQPAYFAERSVEAVHDAQRFVFAALPDYPSGWFAEGRLDLISGEAQGLSAHIKLDETNAEGRVIETWQAVRDAVSVGDQVRLVAGCDKRLETCRAKFGNVVNFRGFPHIPGDDWVTSYPKRSSGNTGRSYLRFPVSGT